MEIDIADPPFLITPVLLCTVCVFHLFMGCPFEKSCRSDLSSSLAHVCLSCRCLSVLAGVERHSEVLGGVPSPAPGLKSELYNHLPKVLRWCVQDFYVRSILLYSNKKIDFVRAKQIIPQHIQMHISQFRIYYKTQSKKSTVAETNRSQK